MENRVKRFFLYLLCRQYRSNMKKRRSFVASGRFVRLETKVFVYYCACDVNINTNVSRSMTNRLYYIYAKKLVARCDLFVCFCILYTFLDIFDIMDLFEHRASFVTTNSNCFFFKFTIGNVNSSRKNKWRNDQYIIY